METKTRHTPTPWEISYGADSLISDDGKIVLTIHRHGPDTIQKKGHISIQEGHANAAFIMHAVNSHEKLLTALKAIRVSIGEDDMYTVFRDLYKTIDEAIKSAEEK